MGLIMKKDDSDDKEYIDGIEVIGRGEGPNGDDADAVQVEVHEGLTAEDISGKTAAAEAEREVEADPELLDAVDDEDDDAAEDGDAAENEDDAAEDAAAKGVVAEGANATADSPKVPGGRHKLYIAIAVIAVIVAAILGYVIGSDAFGPKGVGSATLTEDQLDSVVATWTLDGATNKITARQAIESQYSLDTVKDENGTYPTPSADVILAYARNQVLLKEAEKRDVKIDDKELAAAAEDTLGTSDFATIASQYQVTEDQAKEIVRQQVTIQKLYKTIVKDAPTAPAAPEEPENGDSAAVSAEYAAYIIDLAGKEWDKEAGTWASPDGTYATALVGEEFTADSASYAQAQKAYAAAYQDYAKNAADSNQSWTEYVNTLFAKADITLYGLFA